MSDDDWVIPYQNGYGKFQYQPKLSDGRSSWIDTRWAQETWLNSNGPLSNWWVPNLFKSKRRAARHAQKSEALRIYKEKSEFSKLTPGEKS